MIPHPSPRDLPAQLLASMPPQHRLSVPDLIERLPRRRTELAALQQRCISAARCGDRERAALLRDEAAELEAAVEIDAIAIRAAVDAALVPIGRTFHQLQELGL